MKGIAYMEYTDKISDTPTYKNYKASNSSNSRKISADSNLSKASGFEEGDKVSGEIIDLRGNSVKVALSDNRIIEGTINSGTSLAIGEEAKFEVIESTPKKLALKVIADSSKASADIAIDRALDDAALPKSERNVSAVSALLNENLSIDKISVNNFLHLASQMQGVSFKTLAAMQHIGIPMTSENAIQLENYENCEHRISVQAGELADYAAKLLNSGTDDEAVSVNNALLNAINYDTKTDTGASKLNTDTLLQEDFEKLTADTPLSDIISNDDYMDLFDIFENLGMDTEQSSLLAKGNMTISQAGSLAKDLIGKISIAEDENTSEQNQSPDIPSFKALLDNVPVSSAVSVLNDNGFSDRFPAINNTGILNTVLDSYSAALSNSNSIGSFMSKNQISVLSGFLSENLPSDFDKSLLNESDTPAMILSKIKNAINTSSKQASVSEKLCRLPEYQELVKNALLDKFAIRFSDLKGKNISRFYDSLEETLGKLSFSLNNGNQDTDLSAVGKQFASINNSLSENIDFMKTLNSLFPYVQLPVKLASGKNNSELYVYTNKKKLLEKPDNVSVLLHLDMEHLGPMDINIILDHKNLTAKFSLGDYSSFDIINDNMSELKGSLLKLGFNVNTEIDRINKKTDLIDDFVSPKTENAGMKRYNFDVRA